MIVFVLDTKEECDKFTVLYEKYRKVVIWYNDEGYFLVSSTLGRDEIIKFAENVN